LKKWILPALVMLVLLPLAAWGTGTLSAPVTFGSLTAGRQNLSLFDQVFTFYATYINNRQVTFDVAANRPAAGTPGRYYFATDTRVFSCDDGTSWNTCGSQAIYTDELTGLGTANAATNQITVNLGATASDDAAVANRVLMTLASTTQGNTGGTWVVGNFQNKLDAGTLGASQTWHNFVIQRVDTGVTDILFSQSATAPTMPTNYTKKRRIGYFLTDGANAVRTYTQDGDTFLYLSPIREVDTTNPGTSAVTTATASCPNGVKTTALLNVSALNGTNNYLLLISPLDVTDNAPSSSAAQLASLRTAFAGPVSYVTTASVRTDTSRAYRFRLSASGAADQLWISTQGCVDRRGRG